MTNTPDGTDSVPSVGSAPELDDAIDAGSSVDYDDPERAEFDQQRADALRAGLADYDLDDDDIALLEGASSRCPPCRCSRSSAGRTWARARS